MRKAGVRRLMPMLMVALVAGACGGSDSDPAADGGGADAPPGASDGALVDGAEIRADAAAGVACGMELCAPGVEKCCVDMTTGSESCVPQADPCTGASVTCDGPEDCVTGETCCGTVAGGGSSMCAAEGSCEGITLCHAPTDCAAGEPFCCPNPVLGTDVCQMTPCPGP